ncbi:MAG: hypothetical protein WCB26_05445, partial [Pseudolabrys sp.]
EKCPLMRTSPPPSKVREAVSIWSIYANYGTQRQQVAIPPQHGRIKAGRAAAIQKQSVLALKLIAEELRELVKRNF